MVSQEQGPRPGDIDLSEFKQIGREVIDAIADYHADLSRRSVLPNVTPQEVAARFVEGLPEEGESPAVCVRSFRRTSAWPPPCMNSSANIQTSSHFMIQHFTSTASATCRMP